MQITDRIHLLKIDFEINISPNKRVQRFVNVILIFGDKITLVDTGTKGSENQIFEYIINQGRRKEEIESIIISHAHPDHIGSASKIKQLTSCKIITHSLEKEWIENIQLQYENRPVPAFFDLVDCSSKVDSLVEDGETLRLQKDLTLKFITSSGHSKSMLNILFEEDKILFTADSVPLKNDIPVYDNYRDLLSSLEAMKKNTQYEIMLTSWTPPIMGRQEIEEFIQEGIDYVKLIDKAVEITYRNEESSNLENCKKTLESIGLSPFLAIKVIDNAFRSHLLQE